MTNGSPASVTKAPGRGHRMLRRFAPSVGVRTTKTIRRYIHTDGRLIRGLERECPLRPARPRPASSTCCSKRKDKFYLPVRLQPLNQSQSSVVPAEGEN